MSAQHAIHPNSSEPTPERLDSNSSQRHLVAVPPLASESTLFETSDPDHQLLLSIATQSFQVIEGKRNITHLGPVVSMAAARSLALQHSLLRERNALHKPKVRNIVAAGNVHVCRISENVSEASVTLHTTHRSHAVAIRMELHHHRWRAAEITIL